MQIEFQNTWYQTSDIWRLLTEEELDVQKLENLFDKVSKASRKFNHVYNQI
jgi:hypothetical protein